MIQLKLCSERHAYEVRDQGQIDVGVPEQLVKINLDFDLRCRDAVKDKSSHKA